LAPGVGVDERLEDALNIARSDLDEDPADRCTS